MNKHFPAWHWFFFPNHLHADYPVPSQCIRRERWAGTHEFLLQWVQRGVISRQGRTWILLQPSSLETLVWPGSVLPNNLIYFSSLWSSCLKSTWDYFKQSRLYSIAQVIIMRFLIFSFISLISIYLYCFYKIWGRGGVVYWFEFFSPLVPLWLWILPRTLLQDKWVFYADKAMLVSHSFQPYSFISTPATDPKLRKAKRLGVCLLPLPHIQLLPDTLSVDEIWP